MIIELKSCLVCVHGGEQDLTKVHCAARNRVVDIYSITDCPDYEADVEKGIYLLMQQISNVAAMHMMSTPVETTLEKIQERMDAIRSLTE